MKHHKVKNPIKELSRALNKVKHIVKRSVRKMGRHHR